MSPERSSHPGRFEIKPLRHPPRAVVRVPGSKSMTNRALVLAALYPPPAGPDGRQVCCIRGALQCEDTEVMIDSLRRLGFHIDTDWRAAEPLVNVETSRERERPEVRPEASVAYASGSSGLRELFVANSGTSMRFLTAMVSLGCGKYRLDGVPRMRERPIEDLLIALRQLGVNVYSENNNGCPPIVVEANGLEGGPVRIKGDVSSQFLSALLMTAPLARKGVTISVEGPLVSEPYVAMTVAMMRQIGLTVEIRPGPCFEVPVVGSGIRQNSDASVGILANSASSNRPLANDVGRPTMVIEPDATAASYFFAAAAITGGEIGVAGLDDSSLQGDIRFVDVLEQMGCQVFREKGALRVRGDTLSGVDVDMNAISDTVMTLAIVACFAAGPTTIRNVAHIRHKETDRLTALATELCRIGAGVEEFSDGLTITPRSLSGAVIETYQDHRLAMSFALAGLRVPGIIIDNPGCVAKTYPRFFQDLCRLDS